MSFLKQLQQQTKNKVSLELFNDPKSEFSDTVLIVSKDNGKRVENTYKLSKDGIDKTLKYYKADALKNKLPEINDTHEGFRFLLKVQLIDFVHPDRRNQSTGLFIAGNDYNLSVNGTRVKSLIKIPLSKINIIEKDNAKYISIIEFTLNTRDKNNKGYIYCDDRGDVLAKLHSSESFTKLNVYKESELVKHIGKVNAGNNDREIENKKLVNKLRNYYNKDL